MSDFFDHLLARSFAPAPAAIRPRAASRFEMESRDAADGVPTEIATEAAQPALDSSADRRTANSIAVGPTTARASGLHAVTASMPGKAEKNSKRDASEKGEPADGRLADDRSSAEALGEIRSARVVAAQSENGIHSRQPAKVAAVAAAQIPERSTQAGPRETVGMTVRPAAVPSDLGFAARKTASERPAATSDRATFSETPQINVSIGRVEIRTTPPTPTPAPRAKRDPGLSLETYLQRRAEGGRR